MKSPVFRLYLIMLGFVLMTSNVLAKEALQEKKIGEYLGAKIATHPDWFKDSFLDLDEDIADATTSNKRLVLYFWQSGCPYCNQLWEDNFSQKDIENKFRNSFEIVAMNMWGDRDVVSVAGKNFTEKAFAEALGIQYTPTLLFFDENKRVVHRLNGYIPPEDFRLSMEYVSGKLEKSQTFGEFSLARKQGNEAKKIDPEKLHKEEFFTKSYDLNRSKQRNKQSKEKYLAVYFEEDNCKNCDLLHEKTLKDPATRVLARQFQSVQFNRYAETSLITPIGEKITAKAWANKLDISYLPAILFFDQNGNEVMRIDVQMRTFHIQSVFDYVLTKAYKTEKNFQRYISVRADKIREQGIDVDIWAY